MEKMARGPQSRQWMVDVAVCLARQLAERDVKSIGKHYADKILASSCRQEDAQVRGDNDQHERLCWNIYCAPNVKLTPAE